MKIKLREKNIQVYKNIILQYKFMWDVKNIHCKYLKRKSSGKYSGLDYAGFEVLTVVAIKSYIFCNIMPCSPVKVNGCFRRTCCLHLQG
jgi:hypothetical protein